MGTTKEAILQASLRLFARDGFEAVSTAAIAAELGMTKGALYKHYASKRAIFDALVQRMFDLDAEHSQQSGVPQDTFEAAPETYRQVSLENLRDFTLLQFDFWTQDEFASNFRKMLSLEQYRNAEMNDLFQSVVVSGPVDYLKDMFAQMIVDGILREGDPAGLAFEFYAPMYLLICISDGHREHSYGKALLERHVEDFIIKYRAV